jgi:hypothetical protein
MHQMLSPSALDYIDEEISVMCDPSGLTCIICSQKIIQISDQSAIKVPEKDTVEGSSSQNALASLFLNKYTVFVDKAEYFHGITRRHRYDTASTTFTSCIVYTAGFHQCA